MNLTNTAKLPECRPDGAAEHVQLAADELDNADLGDGDRRADVAMETTAAMQALEKTIMRPAGIFHNRMLHAASCLRVNLPDCVYA